MATGSKRHAARLRGEAQFSSVAQLHLTLCDATDCGTPGLPVPGDEWPTDSAFTPHLLRTCHHLRGGARYRESTAQPCAGCPVAAKICFRKMNDGSLSFSLTPFLSSLVPLPWQFWGKFLVSEIPGPPRQAASQDCLHPRTVCTLASRCHFPWGFTTGGSDGKESAYDTGDLGSSPWVGKIPGAGNGNSLQCSCLENSKDRGAWRATVHGETESQTGLSD